MKLFYNETIISTSDDQSLTLTNIRIRHINKGDGSSILLENIQSVAISYSSIPLLLLSGIVCILISFTGLTNACPGEREQILFGTGIAMGCLLLFAYMYTRRHYLTVASGGGKPITLLVKGQSTEKLTTFIDLIEENICQRKRELQVQTR